MATVYGSYISSAFRSRADISTSQTNTDFTISVTGYCQMADYYHDSGENFFRKIVIGADTPNTYVTASTAYFSGGGTYGVGSSSRKYKRTHSAQSIEVGVAIHNDGVYTGWSTADSYARTTVTVPAKPSYAVTYNANGGSSTPSSQTQWYGESVTLAGAITRANASATGYKVTYNANGGSCSTTSATAARTTKYTFSKWNTKSDGSGTAYSAGTAYTPNAALALYATWTSSTTTSAVTLPTPTRSGYTFNGWYNGSTKAGNAGASFTPNGNVTLTASWTQNTWTVSYAANGGSSTPSSQTKKSGTALTLASAIGHANATATITTTFNANGGSATGATNNRLTSTKTTSYAFTKWKATNGTLYSAGGSYTTDAATTMTAQWSSSDSYSTITLPTPTRTGYTFNGWYTAASGGTKAGNAGASHRPTANATLYAHWTVVTHRVTLDPQGGSVSPASLTKTYGTALTLPTPYRSGYTFLGWNTAAAGTGTHYGTGSGGYTYDAGDRKLYAQWIGVSVSSFSVYRSDSAGTAVDDGTYARATASWSAGCTGTSGVTKTLTVKYLSGSTETTAGTTSTTGSYGVTVGSGSTFAADTSYRFTATATVTWTYNGSSRSVSATRVATIPKVFRLFDALHGGTGLAIGTIATLASTLEVGLTSLLNGVVMVMQGNLTRDGQNTVAANGDHPIQFVDSSQRQMSYIDAHKTNNSPNNYLRLTAIGPSGSKTANVYISASDTNGYISTDCVWAGSIVSDTSAHIIKDTRFNRDGANPSSNVWSAVFGFQDKDGENLGYLQAYQLTNGTTGLQVRAIAETSSGTEAENFIRIQVNKSGNKAYSVGDAAAFRSAIGAQAAGDYAYSSTSQHPYFWNAGGSDQLWGLSATCQRSTNTSYYGKQVGLLMTNTTCGCYDNTDEKTLWTAYTTAHKPSASDVGALPTSGGTLTGSLTVSASGSPLYVVKSTSIDLSKTNNNVSSTLYPALSIHDSAGRIAVRLEEVAKSDGGNGFNLYARQYNTSGTQTAQLGISGNIAQGATQMTYAVSSPANFRSAISAHVAGVSLYDNASGTNGTVNLSATAANYAVIQIFFKGNDGTFDSTSVYSPNGKVVSLGMLESNANGGNNKKWRSVTISGTSITTKFYSEQDNAGAPSATNHIYITKVIGYTSI